MKLKLVLFYKALNMAAGPKRKSPCKEELNHSNENVVNSYRITLCIIIMIVTMCILLICVVLMIRLAISQNSTTDISETYMSHQNSKQNTILQKATIGEAVPKNKSERYISLKRNPSIDDKTPSITTPLSLMPKRNNDVNPKIINTSSISMGTTTNKELTDKSTKFEMSSSEDDSNSKISQVYKRMTTGRQDLIEKIINSPSVTEPSSTTVDPTRNKEKLHSAINKSTESGISISEHLSTKPSSTTVHSTTDISRSEDDSSTEQTNSNLSKEIRSNSTCKTLSCKRSASQILSLIDHSVDPCDDFYHYVCGGLNYNHINYVSREAEVDKRLPSGTFYC